MLDTDTHRADTQTVTTDLKPDEIISQVQTRLALRFPALSADTIETAVREEFAGFTDAKVHDYLSVLTERRARERLAKIA